MEPIETGKYCKQMVSRITQLVIITICCVAEAAVLVKITCN